MNTKEQNRKEGGKKSKKRMLGIKENTFFGLLTRVAFLAPTLAL